MKSPKFKLRRDDLSVVVTEANIKATWRNEVRSAMRGQLLVDPIEFYDVHLNLVNVAAGLAGRVMSGEFVPHAPKRILLEKSKGLCRQIVIPHPYDSLLLQCLSDNLHPSLRAKAPHPNAFYQPDRGIANRAKTDYGGRKAWLDFQKTILSFSKNRKIVVVSDIANFYDTISYSHLRNVLSDNLPDNKESILDLTLHILAAMLWQPDYMPRVEVGLPQMNLDAPRMLANAFLFELDKFISKARNIDYARYMDDIDLGVDGVSTAKIFLRDIDLILQSRQVRLNAGKTKILVGNKVDDYFRIRHNHVLDLLQARIEVRPTHIQRHRRTLGRLLTSWMRKGAFDREGNGEKILKRLLNLAAKVDYTIPVQELESVLQLRPAVREETFRYVGRTSNGARYIPSLIRFIKSPEVVDDGAVLMFANCLVEMRTPAVIKERREIAELALSMLNHERKSVWTHAALWLLSKYATKRQVMEAIDKSYGTWQADYFLGRLVAALECIVPEQSKTRFDALLRASRNAGAAEVSEFYNQILNDRKATRGIYPFLRANNKNANKISHPKWLVLLYVLGSPVVLPGTKAALRNIHHIALTDRYYRIRARPFLRN